MHLFLAIQKNAGLGFNTQQLLKKSHEPFFSDTLSNAPLIDVRLWNVASLATQNNFRYNLVFLS